MHAINLNLDIHICSLSLTNYICDGCNKVVCLNRVPNKIKIIFPRPSRWRCDRKNSNFPRVVCSIQYGGAHSPAANALTGSCHDGSNCVRNFRFNFNRYFNNTFHIPPPNKIPQQCASLRHLKCRQDRVVRATLLWKTDPNVHLHQRESRHLRSW